jgi:transcriptional regulator with XRE-family HTH domain
MDPYAMSDRAILAELGRRIRRARLDRNLSQQRVADLAGLNRMTVAKIEQGAPTSLLTLVQILRALGALEEIAALLPDPGPSPLELARRQGRRRRRASRESASPKNEESSW